jgi:hypothetical protein
VDRGAPRRAREVGRPRVNTEARPRQLTPRAD